MNFESVILDPLSHNNNRTEFKIPNNKMILSTLRISNLGLIANIPVNEQYTYDSYAGIYGLIKNIYLIDGGQIIDSLNEVQCFMAFKNSNISNDDSVSNNQQLVSNSLGYNYDIGESRLISGINYNVVSYDKFIIAQPVGGSNLYVQSSVMRYDVNLNEKASSYIDLTRCLNFLKSIIFLDTSIFNNLRLVIEYNDPLSALIKYTFNSILDVSGVTSVATITRPILLFDEITDDIKINEIKNKYNQTVNYNPIELINTPFQLTGALANFNKKLTGFNGKFLNRICIFKQEYINFLRCVSYVYQNETFNIVINGRQLYPYDLDSKNKRLYYLTEAWGEFISIGDENDINKQIKAINTNNANDYNGSMIQQKIEEFILNMSVNDPRSGIINLLIYGEVRKQMIINNGEYIIQYI